MPIPKAEKALKALFEQLGASDAAETGAIGGHRRHPAQAGVVVVASDQLRAKVEAISQRRALQRELASVGADGLLSQRRLLVGEAASALRASISSFCAGALGKGRTMPNGYTLTVCYGVDSLLPRVPGWLKRLHPTATYLVGMHSADTGVEPGFTPTALVDLSGELLKDLVTRFLTREPPSWPWQLFWVEESLKDGVVFDEYAGTPQCPPGADDRRIFEVACW